MPLCSFRLQDHDIRELSHQSRNLPSIVVLMSVNMWKDCVLYEDGWTLSHGRFSRATVKAHCCILELMSRQILEQITAEKSLNTRRFDVKIFLAYSRSIYKSRPLKFCTTDEDLVFNDFPVVICSSICLLISFYSFWSFCCTFQAHCHHVSSELCLHSKKTKCVYKSLTYLNLTRRVRTLRRF